MTTNMAKDSEFYMSYRLSWQPSNIVTCLFALANAYQVSDLAALYNWTDVSRTLET